MQSDAEPRRFAPAEGWLTVVLHAVILCAAAATVARVPLAPPLADLLPLTIGGLLIGLAMAKLRFPDLVAHALAFLSGIAASLVVAAVSLDGVGGVRSRLATVATEVGEWSRALVAGRQVDDPRFFGVVLGLTVWLVAYTSAWVLYRRGWLATAVLLPGAIATVNIGYLPGAGTEPLLVIVAASCVLAARHALFRREQRWGRLHLATPPRLPLRFLAAGLNLALVAALLGWTLPFSARDDFFDAAWEQLQAPAESIAARWDDLLARFGGSTDFGGGSYAAFGDQFRLGGALRLSDDPVMRFETDLPRPTYLAGHRYDYYTGHGWRSDVETTFERTGPDGRSYASQMGFLRGQGVHLSSGADGVLDDRSQVDGTVTVIRPKGDLLFTVDTYLTADRPTNVQLSWQQVRDEPYALADGSATGVPVDLQQVATLLIGGRFAPGDGSASSPPPTDPALAARIADAQANLAGRFLEVAWAVGPDGQAETLFATGQLPVYDDVEAVFASNDQPIAEGDAYEVTGLASTAAPAVLREAGQDYPSWVTERYLQLPDTITARTRDLAAEFAANGATPFDVALAIQNYVRAAITYEEEIDPPPADQDVVDYVLFDSQEGYCEYYASAMAVLTRLNGIPARVVGGYYPVPYDAEAGGYLYRERNAHLWVEAFFPGYGWIPFEPTASREPLTYGEPIPEDAAADDEPPPPVSTPEPEPEPEPEPDATPAPATVDDQGGFSPPDLLADPGRTLAWAGLGLIGAAAIALLAAAVLWQIGFRGLSPAGGAYARALRAGRFVGVEPSAALTPREYADRLGRAIPSAQGPARIVADLYTEDRYAPSGAPPDRFQMASEAWGRLRRSIVGSRFGRR